MLNCNWFGIRQSFQKHYQEHQEYEDQRNKFKKTMQSYENAVKLCETDKDDILKLGGVEGFSVHSGIEKERQEIFDAKLPFLECSSKVYSPLLTLYVDKSNMKKMKFPTDWKGIKIVIVPNTVKNS